MTPERLALPAPPSPPVPWRFPVVAVLAPVVMSVLIWMVTGSTFALVFAALGPVTAIASVVDQRWGRRRGARRELARFRADADALADEIERLHGDERLGRDDAAPDGPSIVMALAPDRGRWIHDGGALGVSLGRGAVTSALEVDAVPRGADEGIVERMRELRERAGTFEGAVIVDAGLGIGVCGPRRAVTSVVRGLIIQCSRALSPATYWIGVSDDRAEDWLAGLPHESRKLDQRGFVVEFGRLADGHVIARIAAGATESELPESCRVVLAVATAGPGRIIVHPDRRERRDVVPAFVSALDAAAWSVRARRDAAVAGLVSEGGNLPTRVALHDILRAADTGAASTLACEVGVGGAGPVTVDLVAHGPHAIVGGTTGSGKSEFLVSWVLAMAAAYSPEQFTVLLVDFKGGSAFSPLESLPHTVGIITDLDPDQAARALASLRAELRHRERELARARARSLEETDLPRLLIIVDEFAAMIAEHPDLHSLFIDIAARGRSLGLHLILCTQRPAAAVRDGVLANADLRVSLRVNNAADSTAVVGTTEASELGVEPRGRAILKSGGDETVAVQVALASPEDAALVAGRWSAATPPRRPWCDPLPTIVTATDLDSSSGIPLGLLDLPEEQRYATASYDPITDGPILVLGAPRSGKSTALAALGCPSIPGDPCSAWDALTEVARDLDTGAASPRLVVIDDLDALLPRFGAEHRIAWLDLLTRVLRQGPGAGYTVAASAQRVTGELGAIAGLFPARLMLRHVSRQDWMLAGGEPGLSVESGPPGAGRWKGQRIQVVAAEPVASTMTLAWDTVPERPVAIATTRAASVAADLSTAGLDVLSLEAAQSGQVLAAGAVVVADVDEWHSRWGALGALRSTCEILLEGCTPADLRALTRSRALPPPLPAEAGACWRLRPDGSVGRARLPGMDSPGED